MRRHGLLISGALVFALCVAASAAAHTTPQIQAQQAHARAVRAEVDRIGNQLMVIEDRASNAQYRLTQVKASLASNTRQLRFARANFHEAQRRIMERLYSLYVGGTPTTLDVLAGAQSLSQVIDNAEAAHTVALQDAQLGRDALEYEQAIQTRQHNLTTLRAKRASEVQSLNSEKQQIQSSLARQRQLLASIHTSIRQLQVQEAQREAAQRAAAEARLRAIAAAQAAAAAAAASSASSSSGGLPPVSTIVGNGSGHPEAARIALQYLGVPYVWGGASPSGFDCSGLVMYVYGKLGISLPHYTVSQWDDTESISQSQAQPGDLVFFNGLEHVGIYLGGGEMVDAPHTGAVVRTESIYGFGSIDGFRRVP
jgi:cell wall-associated NlpC family hydrolase